jgi:hypothetical protein
MILRVLFDSAGVDFKGIIEVFLILFLEMI